LNSRINNLIAYYKQLKIDALIVNQDYNIRYLTDFPSSESWLFVTRNKAYYITDFRYVLEAKNALKGVALVEYTSSLYQAVFELAKSNNVKRIGFDEQYFSVFQFKKLRKFCPKSIKLINASNMIERLRETKDASEIKKIKSALRIHNQAHQYLKRIIRPGKTEREILLKLENFVKSKGVTFSFDPIVASGPNSCYPHAQVTTRKIRQNEPVLIDMGIDYQGYKSDLTRMFFLGKISNLVREVNAHVQKAQLKAREKIKAGITVAEIDLLARNYLEKNKLAKYFGHSFFHNLTRFDVSKFQTSKCPSFTRFNMFMFRYQINISVKLKTHSDFNLIN